MAAGRYGLVVMLAIAVLCTAPLAAQVNYEVGPQDVLVVNVFGQPDLSGKFAVEADGSFTFSFIGRVKVGGLTLREVEDLLKKGLADGYLRNPQVSVAIEEFKSQRVFVVGEVRQSGPVTLNGEMTLIEALARAGYTTPDAGGEAIISRLKEGARRSGADAGAAEDRVEVLRVDIKELQSGKASLNVRLQDGDMISVPRAELVYVTGQVNRPNSYPLQKGMTVLQALALAGGPTERGATNRIVARRIVDGTSEEVKLKLEDPVLPGDTIVVPEKFF